MRDVPGSDDKSVAVTSGARRLVIVCGASNVTLALPLLPRLIAAGFPGDSLDIVLAHGHGRSLGLSSSVFGRRLPGVRSCGLWTRLPDLVRQADHVHGLVTDVGNDVLYGVDDDRLTDWLRDVLDRMSEYTDQVAFAGLPVARLSQLQRWQFELVRRAFFPGKLLAFDGLVDRIRNLNARLSDLAAQGGVRTLEPPLEWYTWDPIHIARRSRPIAWSSILRLWPQWQPAAAMGVSGSVRDALRAGITGPEKRRVFGLPLTQPQPSLIRPGFRLFQY